MLAKFDFGPEAGRTGGLLVVCFGSENDHAAH